MSAEEEAVLPLARVRKLMKQEPDIKAVTQEASVLVAKATELFLEFLTSRAAAKRGSNEPLGYVDLADAVAENERLDFLADVVPRKVSGSVAAQPRAGAAD